MSENGIDEIIKTYPSGKQYLGLPGTKEGGFGSIRSAKRRRAELGN